MNGMDADNPALRLCIQGTQAEFEGRIDDARAFYEQAWEASRDDYEACIAAHYVARRQTDPQTGLHWNQVALSRALAAGDERVRDFYPSLYVNLGRSYELLGDQAEASRYYKLAADLGLVHQDGQVE
jgi:tetratricopeptide (TPR) repeat protein